MKNFFILILVIPIFINVSSQVSQKDTSFCSTYQWLKDQTTIPFGKKGYERNSFSGLRLIFEPQWGYLIQNDDNRIKIDFLMNMSKFDSVC